MRLYLSSFRFGNEPKKMLSLIKNSGRTAVIMNSMDSAPTDIRAEKLIPEINGLIDLGLKPVELDLRDYFGKSDDLKKYISKFDYIWVRGGNVFNLRRAYKQSGFDKILVDLLNKDKIAYGGYSAGCCVLSPSLKGLETVDPIDDIPKGYKKAVIWDGLSIIDYAFVPHYKSDHPESELVDKSVEYLIENNIPFKTLKDGEAIIVNNHN